MEIQMKLDTSIQSELIKKGKAVMMRCWEKVEVGDTILFSKGQAHWSARVKVTVMEISQYYKEDEKHPNNITIEVVEAFNPRPEAVAFWMMH